LSTTVVAPATLNDARARARLVTALSTLVAACTRSPAVETSSAAVAPAHEAPAGAEASAPAPTDASASDASPWSLPPASDIDGPHEELSLERASDAGPAARPIYYALPRRGGPLRLVAHLHGMCGAPSYACGRWIGAGTDVGVMVCPTGNARCGASTYGPPSWEAPSWPELVAIMDRELESAVAKVEARRPGAIRREGAVLTGYSRGAYAAPVIARRHPGRWPYLVLIEASAPLSAGALRGAGVRAVALVAGEQGSEIAGMRRTAGDLDAQGLPARLFVMRRTGHLYSEDMEQVMHDALAFVLSHEPR
jgi:hypothetical protein